MAVANGGFPFTQRDVVTEIYGDSSNRSLTELFSAAIGTFDPAYVGSKNSLYNFRNYQHIQPNGGYGRLYNGYVVNDSRNIAPVGWHVPTIGEFNTLNSVATGMQLKSTNPDYWIDTYYASDAFEFNSVGSGNRYYPDYRFLMLRMNCTYWGTNGNYMGQDYESATSIIGTDPLQVGYSIRLVKDDSNNTGIMTDNSGYTYKTVKIGNQVWMASNLRGTKYRNGDTIPTVTDNAAWAALTTGACCSYNNNDAYSYADNYVLPGATVRIEIKNYYAGTTHYLYAQAININTGSPIAVNTNVTVLFTYAYYDYTSNTVISKNTYLTIMSGNNRTTNIVIGGPFVSCTATSVFPTNYNSYTYII